MVDHVVVVAVEEDSVGEGFGEALVKFALVHFKSLRLLELRIEN